MCRNLSWWENFLKSPRYLSRDFGKPLFLREAFFTSHPNTSTEVCLYKIKIINYKTNLSRLLATLRRFHVIVGYLSTSFLWKIQICNFTIYIILCFKRIYLLYYIIFVWIHCTIQFLKWYNIYISLKFKISFVFMSLLNLEKHADFLKDVLYF